MQLYHSSLTDSRIEVFYSLEGSDLTSLGYLKPDCTMPDRMYRRIITIKEAYEAFRDSCEGTPADHCASDIYNSKGQLKDLKIYGNSWRYTRSGSATTKTVSHATLKADVQYFALCIAMRNKIEENSIAFLILKSVILNMYNAWVARK